MSRRSITLSVVLASGCVAGQQPVRPAEPTAPAAEVEAPPQYDPDPVPDGIYRLDTAAGLDAVDAALVAAGRAAESPEVRAELGGGTAWLVLDRRGESLLLYTVPGEPARVEGVGVLADSENLALTLADRSPRDARALCRAGDETRLHCDLDGGDLETPLPLVLERASEAEPGLPEAGIYRWEPALGMEDAADVESLRDSLVSSGVQPDRAQTLASDLMSRPSLNIIAGDSMWTLNHGVSVPDGDASGARIERGAYPLAQMQTTAQGFQIERRTSEGGGAIIEECRLMDAGFSCRSGGRESIYQRISPPAM